MYTVHYYIRTKTDDNTTSSPPRNITLTGAAISVLLFVIVAAHHLQLIVRTGNCFACTVSTSDKTTTLQAPLSDEQTCFPLKSLTVRPAEKILL